MRCASAFILFLVGVCHAHDDIDKLVESIKSTRTVFALPQLPARAVDGKFDSRIAQALAELFDSISETEHSELRWLISSQLMSAKDPNPRYFLELEKELKWFLSLDVPSFIESPGHVPSDFQKWCEALVPPMSPQECSDTYVWKPMRLLLYAHLTKDTRFIPLFRQGLTAAQEPIWRTSAGSLGLLNDRESLPKIARKIAGSDPTRAIMLVEWDDPLADQLALDIAKSDEKALSMVRKKMEGREERKRNLRK